MKREEAQAYVTRGTAVSRCRTFQRSRPLTIKRIHLMLILKRWKTIWVRRGTEPNSIYDGPVTSLFSKVTRKEKPTHLWTSHLNVKISYICQAAKMTKGNPFRLWSLESQLGPGGTNLQLRLSQYRSYKRFMMIWRTRKLMISVRKIVITAGDGWHF